MFVLNIDFNYINVREYRRAIKNVKSRETDNKGYTRLRKIKQIHKMRWTLLYANKQTHSMNKLRLYVENVT